MKLPPRDCRACLSWIPDIPQRLSERHLHRRYPRPDWQPHVLIIIDRPSTARFRGHLQERQAQHLGGFQLLQVRRPRAASRSSTTRATPPHVRDRNGFAFGLDILMVVTGAMINICYFARERTAGTARRQLQLVIEGLKD